MTSRCYNKVSCGGYSSAAERLTVAQDVAGSIPASRPKKLSFHHSFRDKKLACGGKLERVKDRSQPQGQS